MEKILELLRKARRLMADDDAAQEQVGNLCDVIYFLEKEEV